jgi:hypothetical protein
MENFGLIADSCITQVRLPSGRISQANEPDSKLDSSDTVVMSTR